MVPSVMAVQEPAGANRADQIAFRSVRGSAPPVQSGVLSGTVTWIRDRRGRNEGAQQIVYYIKLTED